MFKVVVLYCTWCQGLQSLYCLSSWAAFLHVCWRSSLKVLKVWEIGGGGHLGGIWGIFIIFRRVSFWNHTISLKHERSGLVAV